MFDDVELNRKKKRKILFSRQSLCLQELLQLIRQQKHRTLVLWAFACVKEPLTEIETNYPEEQRPRIAFELCQKWAHGTITMPSAKRAILDCHKVGKEIEDPSDIALCHAIGQGLSTVHVETHAIGLPIYELTALVIKNYPHYQTIVSDKIQYYIDTLHYFEKHIDQIEFGWADFLQRDDVPNKEKKIETPKNHGQAHK